jgi:hypothetical protein
MKIRYKITNYDPDILAYYQPGDILSQSKHYKHTLLYVLENKVIMVEKYFDWWDFDWVIELFYCFLRGDKITQKEYKRFRKIQKLRNI